MEKSKKFLTMVIMAIVTVSMALATWLVSTNNMAEFHIESDSGGETPIYFDVNFPATYLNSTNEIIDINATSRIVNDNGNITLRFESIESTTDYDDECDINPEGDCQITYFYKEGDSYITLEQNDTFLMEGEGNTKDMGVNLRCLPLSCSQAINTTVMLGMA